MGVDGNQCDSDNLRIDTNDMLGDGANLIYNLPEVHPEHKQHRNNFMTLILTGKRPRISTRCGPFL